MRYNSRQEVERIGLAGAYHYYDGSGTPIVRMLSSYWLAVEPEDQAFSPWAKTTGYWEAWVTCAISNIVNPGDVVIDAGANVGVYTLMLAQHGCNVVAFEPNPDLIPYIKKSVEINNVGDRIVLENSALSCRDGQVNLYVPNGHSGGATILGEVGEPKTVSTVTLDSYARNLDRVDFVKIDTEGAEPYIWAGGYEFRCKFPRCVFLMEWSPVCYADPGSFWDTLTGDGYAVTEVAYNGRERSITKQQALDVQEWITLVARREG